MPFLLPDISMPGFYTFWQNGGKRIRRSARRERPGIPGPPNVRSENADVIELSVLEDRILFSAAPVADLVDGAEPFGTGEEAFTGPFSGQTTQATQAATAESLDAIDQEVMGLEELTVVGESAKEFNTASDRLQERQLLVVDRNLDDLDTLLGDFDSGGPRVDVVHLDDDSQGFQLITEALRVGSEMGHHYSSIQIVTHGGGGAFELGAEHVNRASIVDYRDDLQAWREYLTADADILLYGCNVAATADGEQLVDQMAAMTGADVAASRDVTGHALLGGDWDLEYATGAIGPFASLIQAPPNSWLGSLEITTDNVTLATAGAGAGDTSFQHATAGTDRLMLIGVTFGGHHGSEITSVEYASSALFKVGALGNQDTSESRAEIWALVNPDLGNHTVTVDFSSTTHVGVTIGVATFNGVDQTTPLGLFAADEGDSESPSVDVVSAAGEKVFGLVAVTDSDNASISPGAGQTELWDEHLVQANGAGSLEDGALLVATSWSLDDDDDWVAAGVSVRPSLLANSPVGPVSDTDAAANQIREDAANGDAVGITAEAIDPDLADQVTYALDDDAAGRFQIDSNSGTVTVADSTMLDFETDQQHQITVRASSDDGSFSTATFNIQVDDVVEGVVITDQAFSIAENLSNGSLVGQVSAADLDVVNQANLTYTVVGGTGSDALSLNASTGELTVSDSSYLDFEFNPSYNLLVQVSDPDGDTDQATITVNLQNLKPEQFIRGRIVEDIDGDGDVRSNRRVLPNVQVHLYRGGLAEADPLQVRTTQTNSKGVYLFAGLANGDYQVVVDSRSIDTPAGLNSGYTAGDVWAQQTYAAAGAVTTSGGTDTVSQVAGAVFGGRRVGISDDATTLATAEHVNLVTVAGSDVDQVDFAFSFNVVTNTLAGDTADDDLAQPRSVQGSLRQFVQNANAVAGENRLRFVPVEATNAQQGPRSWWRVEVTEGFDAIVDDATILDGTAWDANDPQVTRNTSSGIVRSIATVGVQGTPLQGAERPELEIVNNRGTADANAVAFGMDIQANDIEVSNLGIRGFGINNSDANVRVGSAAASNLSGIVIQQNIIGSQLYVISNLSSTDHPIYQNRGSNIRVHGATQGQIHRNLIAFADRDGILFEAGAESWDVRQNEIRENSLQSNYKNGINVQDNAGNIQIRQNLITENRGSGIDSIGTAGQLLIANNTVEKNGLAAAETAGIRLFGQGSIVFQNIIRDNQGPGVLIPSDSPLGSASSQNRISQNRLLDNGTIAIDLVDSGATLAEQHTGDGRSLNDLANDPQSGNTGIDYAVIGSAVAVDGEIQIRGIAGPNQEVEIYSSNPADTQLEFLAAVATDASGNFNTSIQDVSLPSHLKAIAMDAANNTSEFSDRIGLVFAPEINGTQTFEITDAETVTPFETAIINDADGDAVSVSISFDATLGDFTSSSLLASGFVQAGAGLYTRGPSSAGAASDAIQQLLFDPASVDLSDTVSIAFELGVDDGTTLITNSSTIVEVSPEVEIPIAVDDQFTVAEGGTWVGQPGVLSNDLMVDHPSTTVTVIASPDHGELTLNTDGIFVYTHDGSETIGDSFSYRVANSNGWSIGDVGILIDPVNDAPTAVAEELLISDEDPILFTAELLLSNDSDVDSATISVAWVNSPDSGEVFDLGGGTYEFVPASEAFVKQQIEYGVTDGNQTSIGILNVVQVAPVDGGSPGGGNPQDGDSGNGLESNNPDTNEPPADDDNSDRAENDNSSPEGGAAPDEPNREKSHSDDPDDIAPLPPDPEILLDFDELASFDRNNGDGGDGILISADPWTSERAATSYSLKSQLGQTLSTDDSDRGETDKADSAMELSTQLFAYANAQSEYHEQLQQAREEFIQVNLDTATMGQAAAVTGVLTVGYALWMVRGGLLVASFMSSVPMWQSFDPLPILASTEKHKGSGETLESLIGGGNDNKASPIRTGYRV